MQARVMGMFAVVLAVGPALGGLEPQTDGPAPVLDGLAWELRQRGITAGEPDVWVQESGDRMIGDLTFVDDDDATTARIEAGTGDAVLGRLTVASADIAGDLTCTGCVNDPDVDLAYAASAAKGGPALDADNLDGLDSSRFLRSDTSGTIAGDLQVDGDAAVIGRLEAASLGLKAQKVCASAVGGYGFFAILVPSGWTAANCQAFMAMAHGGSLYRLGCLFNDGFSVSSSYVGGPPSPNCGW